MKLVSKVDVQSLQPPCSFQGGKQRLCKDIVSAIMPYYEGQRVYDLCCGSGAVTIQLLKSGVDAHNVTMIDQSSYGRVYERISNKEFSLKKFRAWVDSIPDNLREVQGYLKSLSKQPVDENEPYVYLLLQAGSFGSKQIWVSESSWRNCSFRSYWEPTPTSNRRSPVNPMMPLPEALYNRTHDLVLFMQGKFEGICTDLNSFYDFEKDSLVYIDPPYVNTTGYGFSVDYDTVINRCLERGCTVFLSEGYRHKQANRSVMLSKGRAKGNISGDIEKAPTQEWLNIFEV